MSTHLSALLREGDYLETISKQAMNAGLNQHKQQIVYGLHKFYVTSSGEQLELARNRERQSLNIANIANLRHKSDQRQKSRSTNLYDRSEISSIYVLNVERIIINR